MLKQGLATVGITVLSAAFIRVYAHVSATDGKQATALERCVAQHISALPAYEKPAGALKFAEFCNSPN